MTPLETALTFGNGNLVIDTGTYNGRPAVFIAPSKNTGEVGASAKSENHPLDRLMPEEHVWTFPSMEQAKRVADALCTPIQLEDATAEIERLKAELEEAREIIGELISEDIIAVYPHGPLSRRARAFLNKEKTDV